jgi:hypothetical protein
VSATRTFASHTLLIALLAVAGAWLWLEHARAWDLGRASPVLGYDAAQYAVAARELAEHGRLATPFALPVELARHATPPWPLALVQPGLVLVESALFRIAGTSSPERSSWLVLVLPFVCYLAAGIGLAVVCSRLVTDHAPEVTALERFMAAFVVGLAFLLDPEAQHFAIGGFTELPFTLGLAASVALLALDARTRPIAFGVGLGVAGLFRGNILWLAPILAAAYGASAPERRVRAFTRALLGLALVLAPWWIYKGLAFGNPAWDLSALSLWDGVGGRTWFNLNHLPEPPSVPHGMDAVLALARKTRGNLPSMVLQLSTGPRTLWIGSLAIAAVIATRRGRSAAGLAAAAWAILAMLAVTAIVASLTVPLLRYLMPVRLVAEAAGLIALWGLIWRLPSESAPLVARRALCIALAVLALGWGGWQTVRGHLEAQRTARDRGVPTARVLAALAAEIDQTLPPGEPLMSNLGPSLAWVTRRPIIHLALTPGDVDACRRLVDFRHVVTVFRDPAHAWTGWTEAVRRPGEAPHNREWNIATARSYATDDGFTVVWFELGVLPASFASDATARGSGADRP